MTAALRRRTLGWALAVGALAAGTAVAAAALRGPTPPGTLEGRVTAIASSLRCPVCQNLSVADSPSRLAAEMRAGISRDLQAGKTAQEIQAEFVAAYGEWVLLEPPKRGLTLLPWLAPVLFLSGGLVAVGLLLRRQARLLSGGRPAAAVAVPAVGGVTDADRQLLDRALAKLDAEEQT